jgi:hypothetical protein
LVLSRSDFAGDGTPSSSFKHGEAPEEERESGTAAPVANEVQLIRKKKLDFSAPLTWHCRSLAQRPARKQFLAAFDEGTWLYFATLVIASLEQISPPHEVVPAAQPLSIEEKVRFAQLTRIVETNLSSFLAAGKALAEIKNSRLYRERFSSFEEFARATFGLCRSMYDQLVRSHWSAFSTIGDSPRKRDSAAEPS